MTCTCKRPARAPKQLALPLRDAGYGEAYCYALEPAKQEAWLCRQAMRPMG